MANALYDLAREGFLKGDIDWLTPAAGESIKAALVDTAVYTVALTTDQFYSDLSGVVKNSSSFTNASATGGVADADDITFSAVSGASVEALVIYLENSGADSTWPLIAYIDTATGLPITPSGADISVAWDSGANKIFKL